jgi:hypothetical protein
MHKKESLSGQEMSELQRKLSDWGAEGYSVERLREALSQPPEEARGAFETAEKGIEKLREVAAELAPLDIPDNSGQVAQIRKLLADPWASAEAENALVELQIQSEKKRKQAQRDRREHERRQKSLQEKMAGWKGQGYNMEAIEKAFSAGVEAGEESIRQFEEWLARLRSAQEELKGMDASGFETEKASIEELVRRPDKVHEAEDAILQLRVRIEKRKRNLELLTGKEKAERARLAEKVRLWKEEGFKIDIGPAELDGGELAALQRRIRQTEEAVSRLNELRSELENIQDPKHADEREALRQLLHDPSQLASAEEKTLRLQVREERLRKESERKAEERQKKRIETEARIKEWKDAGYDTSRLEAAMAQDDETLKKEMVMFRIQLRRLKELRAELLSIPPEGIEEEVVRLMEKTKTVSLNVITELESAVAALKGRQEARREQRLKEKEREKNEKQELVEKLTGWVEKGYRDGLDVRLEGVISKDLPALREEIVRIESKVRRMEVLRAELDALDTGGFEAEKAALLEILPDISRTDESWTRMLELKEKVEQRRMMELRKAEEERARREEARARLEEWKRLGYDVSHLEKLLPGDLEALRKDLAMAHMKVQRAEEMRAELANLKPEHFEKETSEILEDLPDLDKIPLNERRMEALHALVGERAAEMRKRADLQKRMEEWRISGYDTRRLENALAQDIDTVTKEFLMFRIRVQKLNDLQEELRSLDITGFEEEASAIRAGLMNVDGVPQMRARLSELELKIGKRISEAVRSTEEKKKAKEECMAKMSAWLSEGFYVDGLEEALTQEPAEMSARFSRFEEGVFQARRTRQELDELSAPGFEELAAGIREELRDVSRVEEARRDMRDLWERIDRRAREAEGRKKEEAELRKGLVRQIQGWREQGHVVEHLDALAGGKVEHLRKVVLDFRIQLERRKDLAGILAALDLRGFEGEAARIRDMMKDVGGLDEASASLDRLKDSIRLRREADAREREEMRRTRDSCIDRFMELLAEGYNIEGLESALELPVPELARERERVDAIVLRLKEIEGEVRRAGLAEGEEAVLSRLKDINALPQLKEWLAQKIRKRRQAADIAAQASRGPQQGTADHGLRKGAPLDPEKLSALRAKLDELKRAGHDVSELESYLDSGTITAEGMRTRLVALNRRIKGEPDASLENAPSAPKDEGGDGRKTDEAGGIGRSNEEENGDMRSGEEENGDGAADRSSEGEPVKKLKRVRKVTK